MARLIATSDLHLGHSNILKFREGFKTVEEHNEILLDNLKSSVNKRDHLILLGDIAFTPYWNERIKEVKCLQKTLILGNHETDRQVPFQDLVDTYDKIHSLWSRKRSWFSHCPIHPQEFRGKEHNIHGHLHGNVIKDDPRYVNVCVDHHDFKPVDLTVLLRNL